jgi:hypothetical protein
MIQISAGGVPCKKKKERKKKPIKVSGISP